MQTRACTAGYSTVICSRQLGCGLLLCVRRSKSRGSTAVLSVQVRNHVLATWRTDVSRCAALELHDLLLCTQLGTRVSVGRACCHHLITYSDNRARICVPSCHTADRWLSEADAANGIWQKHRAYVTTAWRFLNDHGYINFGVAPAIRAKMLAAPPSKGAVIIVGAGMAGGLWPYTSLLALLCCRGNCCSWLSIATFVDFD
jgi:hypothetical protein